MEDPDIDSRGGDAFIFDSLPANFTVGCDTKAFSSTESFTGFRDIPPGIHLIWIASSESMSSRSGYWICTPELEDTLLGRTYVKQWDRFNEILRDSTSAIEEGREAEMRAQRLTHLVPYDLGAVGAEHPHSHTLRQGDSHAPDLLGDQNIWYQLTSAIRPGLLSCITRQAENTWYVTTTDSVAGETRLAQETRLYASGAAQLHFTFPMDAHLINPDATGVERTSQALDPTGWIIDKLENPSNGHQPEDLLGEFQFAFLVGMHLGNFSCLEQWFFLAARLIFRSYSLTVERPRQARSLIQTFHAQLLYNDQYLEEDVLEMMPEQARKLKLALTTYKARLDEKLIVLGDQSTPDQQAVAIAFSTLQSWLWQRGWDLNGEYVRSGNIMLEDGEMVQAELSDFEDEDERGEFAPTVVEMENGREAGLLFWDA
ncbi:A1 cistron-splicing factor [Nemania sp. FL0916]|nr:A1 cistron-splicing factor [Nemania sp. FL0916]